MNISTHKSSLRKMKDGQTYLFTEIAASGRKNNNLIKATAGMLSSATPAKR
jgi:hypothetical protein